MKTPLEKILIINYKDGTTENFIDFDMADCRVIDSLNAKADDFLLRIKNAENNIKCPK